MATVTSNPGSIQPDSSFYDTDVDAVTVANSSTYSWDTWTSSSGTTVEHTVTLLGSFTYDAGGAPSGSVAQILLDTDADGSTDLTIAFSTLVGGLLGDLTSGDLEQFFGAAFFQNDTVSLGGTAFSSSVSFYLGGDALESDDTVTITGSGLYGGDTKTVGSHKVGGNDSFTVDSSDPTKTTEIVGDFRQSIGTGGLTGGNDTIVDVTAAGTGHFEAHGDVRFMGQDTTVGGDDVLTATNRRTVLSGDVEFMGEDGSTLEGGDDLITGGLGDDSLYGEYVRTSSSSADAGFTYTVVGGNDTIRGGEGDDLIYGEGSEDVAGVLLLSGGDDSLEGEAGDDTIDGGSGDDELFGGDDDDLLIGGAGEDSFYGGSGFDIVDFSGGLFALTATLQSGGVMGTLVSGGITEKVYDVEGVVGTNVNDSLTGSADDNLFEGGGGNDTLNGGAGLDTASYAYATAAVTVDLALQNTGQSVGGGQGVDRLSSIEGVIGSAFNDTIFGGSTDNAIYGGDGDDILLMSSATSGFPAPGTDAFYGEAGDDTIGFALDGVGQSNLGADHVIDGGAGADTFVFESYSSSYDVVLQSSAFSAGTFVRIGAPDLVASLYAFENVLAGGGDDVITSHSISTSLIEANAGNDLVSIASSVVDAVVDAGEGNDSVTSGWGNDTVLGQAGDDYLIGHAGADVINGGSHDGGGDTASYETGITGVSVDLTSGIASGGDAAGDILVGIENLVGTIRDDTLTGDAAENVLTGGLEQDVLSGEGGNDVINGQEGQDTIDGGAGIDTATYETATGNVDAYLNYGESFGADGEDVLTSIENLLGSNFDDRLVGNAGNNVLSGGEGDDIIKGKGGDDIYHGGLGDDYMFGAEGVDVMFGGDGADILYALAGDDTLNGDAGNDSLYGGRDTDMLNGGADDDVLRGNLGNDVLNADTGSDSLFGGGSNDLLLGGADRDFLLGENGNDTLNGGTGDDNLTGGLAADTFIFGRADVGIGGYDRIKDFENGIDVIDLTAFAFTDFVAQVQPLASQQGANVRIAFGSGDTLLLENFLLADFDAGDVLL